MILLQVRFAFQELMKINLLNISGDVFYILERYDTTLFLCTGSPINSDVYYFYTLRNMK
jgi:hypothetical protein